MNHWQECRAGKMHFRTEGAARRKAAAENRKGRFRVVAYLCTCGRWATGKEERPQRKYKRLRIEEKPYLGKTSEDA